MRKPADSTQEIGYQQKMLLAQKNPYRLLTPGPVPLHPDVQKILSLPAIHHRTPEFELMFKNVTERLKEVFATRETVFVHASTGSGAMESAIVNTLSPGDEVLCIVSGKFGERWYEMAKTFGLQAHKIDVPWGEPVSLSEVKAYLQNSVNVKAVLTQACETSTATVHPIRELGQLIKPLPNVLLLVDAITAVGAMALEMDEWGLDVVIGGSQKAFMLPAGLSFIALSKKAWRFYEIAKCPRYYWDLKAERNSLLKGETHFSSVVPLIRALDVAINLLTGPEKLKTLNRIQNLSQATREIGECYGLRVFSKAPSPSVTALEVPQYIDSQKLRTHIESEYNMTLMGGQDQLKGKILRIGHIGYITNEDMFAFSDILFRSLIDLGMKNLDSSYNKKAHEIVNKWLL